MTSDGDCCMLLVMLLLLLVADEPNDPQCAVHLVSVQQGSGRPVLVWNTIQGL